MNHAPAIVYANRLCDSETMTNKLIFQIKQDRLSTSELDKLQARCSAELNELRQELNELLKELRAIADGNNHPTAQPHRTAA
ncbi:hypothetical protein [Paenibacillus sp. OV219]|uniref:hypothetical protein n=1 Tax=Paenibacillus sp. OV219 TaxID=1884377 RepID=UPI0008CEBF51|nr:hypothetical protein [Paenibacillus sp. OV219]SEO34709.1 hypothetical protein SAMN05518847_107159 [Paenibacillus sp. OV219]